MREIPEELQARLDGGVTTLCRCWRVERADGVVLGFTDHDRALVIDGVRHAPETGLSAGALDTLEGQVLTVHSAPDAAAEETDLLQPGQLVSICENEGDWVGVVYSKNAADCGTGTPVADRRAYDGQCQSGWINGTYLTNQAG